MKDHWIPRLVAKAVFVNQSRATRNSKGDSRQPCLTSVLNLNDSVFCLLCTACAEKPSSRALIVVTMFLGIPYCCKDLYNTSLLMLSKAFLKSKVDVQGGLPLITLFHNDPQCRYMVSTTPTSSRPRLLLSQLLVQCRFDALQDHSVEHLTCYVQQHDATPVFTVAQIVFWWFD